MKYRLMFLFLFVTIAARAQQQPKSVQYYVQGGIGVPTGLFSSIYKLTVNGKVGLLYPLSDKTKLIAETGYMYFLKKRKSGGISFIPLTGGLQYHIAGRTSLSLMAGGALLLEDPVVVYFAVQPGVGVELSVHHSLRLDYTGFVSYGYVVGGLNLSYRFSF